MSSLAAKQAEYLAAVKQYLALSAAVAEATSWVAAWHAAMPQAQEAAA